MSELSRLKEPIHQELDRFESYFSQLMRTNNRLLNIILKYILKTKGKRFRPMLVFYSAKLQGYTNERTFVAAALIELLHTATLVHDDVVDNSQLRRGFFSIKSLWKSKVAVLVGDYLLSKGLLLSVENKAFDLLEIVSEAVKEMAEGEILQIEKARNLDISEALYYEIIRKKTAVLIAASMLAGYKSVSENREKLDVIKEIGINLGMAFQIKDDLFDYQSNQKIIGKPIGNDIIERKITLPLIFALNNADNKERKKILRLLNSANISKKDIHYIIEFVNNAGGVKYANEKMLFLVQSAVNLLDLHFSTSPIIENFKDLMFFVVQRNK